MTPTCSTRTCGWRPSRRSASGTASAWNTCASRRESSGPERFALEYLCRTTTRDPAAVIDPAAWATLPHVELTPEVDCVVAVDAAFDRTQASVVAVGQVDDVIAVELVEQRAGTDWLGPYLLDLLARWPTRRGRRPLRPGRRQSPPCSNAKPARRHGGRRARGRRSGSAVHRRRRRRPGWTRPRLPVHRRRRRCRPPQGRRPVGVLPSRHDRHHPGRRRQPRTVGGRDPTAGRTDDSRVPRQRATILNLTDRCPPAGRGGRPADRSGPNLGPTPTPPWSQVGHKKSGTGRYRPTSAGRRPTEKCPLSRTEAQPLAQGVTVRHMPHGVRFPPAPPHHPCSEGVTVAPWSQIGHKTSPRARPSASAASRSSCAVTCWYTRIVTATSA